MISTQEFQWHEDPLLDEATPLLKLARTIKDNELVFPGKSRFGFYKLMRKAGRKAGFPYSKKIRPHILKHSIVMQSIHTAGIENVRKWVGHQSLSSTGRYLHVSDKEAGQAVGKAIRQSS
jgi:integrase